MRLLTMPEDEKTRLVEDVLANLIKITGEQVDADLVAMTTGLVFGELLKKASSRSPACSTAQLNQKVTDTVFEYIDRMNDYCEQDTAEHIVDGFVGAVEPLLLQIIKSR